MREELRDFCICYAFMAVLHFLCSNDNYTARHSNLIIHQFGAEGVPQVAYQGCNSDCDSGSVSRIMEEIIVKKGNECVIIIL
jgi:hypothetical protein